MALEKQRIARGMVRWFRPRSQSQLRARRVALALTGLSGLNRYLAANLAGKPTTIIHELGTTGPLRPSKRSPCRGSRHQPATSASAS